MSEPHPPDCLLQRAHADAAATAATEAVVAAAHLQLTGLRAGMDALDVGCGCGAVTHVMSTIVGPGRVAGVDSSPSRVAAARTLAAARGIEIEFLAGAATGLPLAAASFDYTWACGVVADLPQPARALAELVRVTRPGGRVVVGELAGPPLAPALQEEVWEAQRLLGVTSFAPGVGDKLSGWCAQAGLREMVVHTLLYEMAPGGVPADALARWRTRLVRGTQRLVAQTRERARWERLRDVLLAEMQRPDRFYPSTLILVCGIVPMP